MRRSIVVGLLALFACQPSRPPLPGAERMKVGLLTPGSVNDNGWNAIAYEGLLRIRKELGAKISRSAMDSNIRMPRSQPERSVAKNVSPMVF